MSESPFKKILIGVDISDQTDAVIATSRRLAEIFGAEVQVVTVVNVPTHSPGNEMDGTPANNQEIQLHDELLARLHKYYHDEANSLDVKVLHGDPAERIAEYAEYSNSDLVIVGSRKQGALRKAIVGSVSDSVAARCKKSVLIVRPQ